MEKPKVKLLEYYDYRECEAYIENKLGYSLSDTLGSISSKEDLEYRNFWYFLMECTAIHNGCYFDMPDETWARHEWQRVILEAFHDEFGEGPYFVAW